MVTPLEIVPRRRLRPVLQFALVVVVLGVSVHLLFFAERGGGGGDRIGLLTSRAELRGEVTRLVEENEALRQRLARIERERQVDALAYRDVEAHLTTLQDQMLSLREEVAFYQAIVSSAETKRLNIQTLVLDQNVPGDTWRFQLVLTRNTKSDTVLSGNVEVAVHGEQQGEARRLSLAELSDDRADSLEFEFRYFQRLEGRLVLPPGFVPRRVIVEATAEGIGSRPVARTFDWPEPVG